eukprot:scaffold740_cov405-Prasinococcus_capsulatus_cf.AAC.4
MGAGCWTAPARASRVNDRASKPGLRHHWRGVTSAEPPPARHVRATASARKRRTTSDGSRGPSH